jgi:Uma2 family endonuclease
MTVATDRRMTLQEFLTYDDGTDRRYELEDGILVPMGTEASVNISITFFLVQAFLQILGYHRLGNKIHLEVRSRYATVRDPDLVIHSEDSAAAILGRSQACLTLSDPNPLIAIEIVSPGAESSDNYQRDYVQKPTEYADRGIVELWQIDPTRKWVKVGTLTDGEYQFTTYQGNDALTSGRSESIVSPSFPELKLTAAQILGA